MKKIAIIVALVATTLFTNCGKKTEDAAPVVDNTPVADANGVIERFSFDTNLNGTRRTGVSFTNLSTSVPVTFTGIDRLNQANKALVVPANAGLQITGLPLPTGNAARTISCWIHFNGTAGSRQFISYGTNAAGQTFGLSFDSAITNPPAPSTPSKLLTYTWASGNDATFNYTPSSNTNSANFGYCGWVHLVAVYTGGTDNKVQLYVNNRLESNITPISIINTTNTTLKIGGFVSDQGLNSQLFMIDDVIIYNRALTQAEITALAADRATGCPS